VEWPAWLSEAVRDRPGSGDGLMVASIQLAIMLGAPHDGLLLQII
jgi:predicted MFS family arabinose efflux permease